MRFILGNRPGANERRGISPLSFSRFHLVFWGILALSLRIGGEPKTGTRYFGMKKRRWRCNICQRNLPEKRKPAPLEREAGQIIS